MKKLLSLSDNDLPQIWRIADTQSGKSQKLTLQLTVAKAGGGVVAALGGALTFGDVGFLIGSWMILIGFAAALISEIISWAVKPEKTWYEGRAVAESVKTLSWRYAIGADPFHTSLSERDADDLLRERVSSVTDELSDRITFTGENLIKTPAMSRLRKQPFAVRRDAYITGRTLEQREWYARKAKTNQNYSNFWRIVLILTEITAVILAFSRITGAWSVDYAGLLGAIIAAGTAWVGVKQFTPLASAYSVACKELSIQADKLQTVVESDWSYVAADAEEAISREHTTWLASRIGLIRPFK